MALAREKRQSGQQALAFAKAAIQRHSLPRSRRTPHDVIMGWLRPAPDDPDLRQEVTRRLGKPT
jgi:hypothetical protein